MNAPFLLAVSKLIVTMERHIEGTALCLAFFSVAAMARVALAALRQGRPNPKR
jgi:hypothetical protein